MLGIEIFPCDERVFRRGVVDVPGIFYSTRSAGKAADDDVDGGGDVLDGGFQGLEVGYVGEAN